MNKTIIILGSGNAALCSGIAALERGANVMMLEKASEEEAGGNSRYTAGAMRFVYDSEEQLKPLLLDVHDARIPKTTFGTYTKEHFQKDLLHFNGGRPLSLHQHILIDKSYETMLWLSKHHIKFEPIYSRQSFQKNGRHIFWGGLTLAAANEGVGLVDAELETFLRLGGEIRYNMEGVGLIMENGRIAGVRCHTQEGETTVRGDAVILGCGGFEANAALREKYMGKKWARSKVRGTRHNMGQGIAMAIEAGAVLHGALDNCHAVPMDLNMPDYGNVDIPYAERKRYRKICYFLGIMLNTHGKRFVDEGENFRNYTYAQFGRAILHQPHSMAWQIFDRKVDGLLYDEYRFWDATYIKADSLKELIEQLNPIDHKAAMNTIQEYNASVDDTLPFNPAVLDKKSAKGLSPKKSNWANKIDTPPFKAFPVTCGITFTYGGLKVDEKTQVLNAREEAIEGLFACGEMVGGVFYDGYPGGAGLTSGAVFGKIAGMQATI